VCNNKIKIMVFILLSVLSYFGGANVALYLVGLFVLFKLLKYWLKKNRGTVDREDEVDAKGKIVIVTGASAGIGKYTAQGLAERGATVILACRTVSKAEKVVEEIRTKTRNGELVTILEQLKKIIH
jgi:NADPH:quinone reductase-like Zn-dependent oxidoreductase